MDIRTYRARSMHDALALVRQELGPDAAVLHTREVPSGRLRRWLGSRREIEVTASAGVNVPSRLPTRMHGATASQAETTATRATPVHLDHDYRAQFRDDLRGELGSLRSMVEQLCQQTARTPHHDLPESLFRVFTDLIDADVREETARELIETVRLAAAPDDLDDPLVTKTRIARTIEKEIAVAGPIRVTPGTRSVVALVGPTGVGKTTTIAKLAANFRLREKRRVGLITVDTYRIAAVEQLRTYADIIDLPMEVVSTPRQMREASARLADLDLVLLDTAGRSPRDDVRVQELKSMLAEARPDEVHLVLSSVAGRRSLVHMTDAFAAVGTTALILTKLDEAAGLGSLLPVLRAGALPLSYLTDGQNVPDDIRVADRSRLARLSVGMEG